MPVFIYTNHIATEQDPSTTPRRPQQGGAAAQDDNLCGLLKAEFGGAAAQDDRAGGGVSPQPYSANGHYRILRPCSADSGADNKHKAAQKLRPCGNMPQGLFTLINTVQ